MTPEQREYIRQYLLFEQNIRWIDKEKESSTPKRFAWMFSAAEGGGKQNLERRKAYFKRGKKNMTTEHRELIRAYLLFEEKDLKLNRRALEEWIDKERKTLVWMLSAAEEGGRERKKDGEVPVEGAEGLWETGEKVTWRGRKAAQRGD